MSASAADPIAPPWLAELGLLEPALLEPLERGSPVRAWTAPLAFTPWLLDVHGRLEDPRDAYRRTPLRTAGGEFTLPEVELVDRLRRAGWRAGWLDAFAAAPPRWQARVWSDADLPDAAHALFAAVGERVGNRLRGRPDVVAWRDAAPADVVYLHYKGAREPMRPSQQEWVQAAFDAGLATDRYALARWWG